MTIKASNNVRFVSKSENIFSDGLDLRKDAFQTISHDKEILLANIYIPNLRKYEKAFSGFGFDHLNVVATWRNISVKQGHELVFWQTAFERALNDQLLFNRLQGRNLSSPKKQKCKF